MQVCKSWEELLYFLSSIRRIFFSSPISSSGLTSSSFVPHISMSCRCLNRGVRVSVRVSPSVLGTPISYMVSECTYTGLLDLIQLSSWISWKTCHSCDFENLQKRTRNCFSTLDASCNTSCNSYEASVVWSKHVSCLCHMGDLYHRSCSFVFDEQACQETNAKSTMSSTTARHLVCLPIQPLACLAAVHRRVAP